MTEVTSQAQRRVDAVDIFASSSLLCAVSIALPLLDLLGRNAAFFVVRDSPASDIVGLALVVTVVLPILLASVAILAERIHPIAGVAIHGVVFVVLGVVLGTSILRQTPLGDLPAWVEFGIAGGAATVLYVAYLRFSSLRLGVRWTWLAPLAVLGLFLFGSSVSRLIVGSASAATDSAEVRNPAPIVFLLFDGLSVSDLMDGEGDLQEEVYPNFARLAKDGTWYRNAITMHHSTERSVPAILSGLKWEEGQIPLLQDHPNNLFTLLDDSFRINATEPITELCPEKACQAEEPIEVPTMGRWRGLASDLGVIAGHLFLPHELAADLPPIDDTWGGFAAHEAQPPAEDGPNSNEFDVRVEFNAALAQDRRKTVRTFTEGINTADNPPALDFLHVLLPHSPWAYLPTGQLSDLPDGRFVSRVLPEGWVDDPWRIDQVQQLHLIQVQYVDTIVGDILERLDTIGTYDETLIVVMADHGETFRPGMPRLRGHVSVAEDVLPIPLFIKKPHQSRGVIDDYRAYSIDVLPTIAEVLGIDLPWQVDGVSLVSPQRPVRNHSEVTVEDGTIEMASDLSVAVSLAKHRIDRFGADGAFGLAPGGYADLLGIDLATLQLDDPFPRPVALRDPGRWTDVDTSADLLPVSFRGRIEDPDSSNVVIAIALNGEIVAVTRSYLDANEAVHFDAMIPPDALRDGGNELRLIAVAGTGPDRSFHPIG